MTERIDGFVIEGGPDSFLASKPRGIGLCEELGFGERPQVQLQGVRRNDVARSFSGVAGCTISRKVSAVSCQPGSPGGSLSLLSPLGKLRVALDYLLPARRAAGDESLGGFVRRRLGREAWERLVSR